MMATSGQADRRTSGQADRRTGGQADKRTSRDAAYRAYLKANSEQRIAFTPSPEITINT